MNDAGKRTILVVEDEILIAEDLRGRLEELGYSVPAVAGSGEEALAFAGAIRIDLALMDVRIQGPMDGIATAAWLKATWGIPIVFLSAFDDRQTIARARQLDPYAFLAKPIGDRDLREGLENAFKRIDDERPAKPESGAAEA
jgi:CheY-like chemotaxis protein